MNTLTNHEALLALSSSPALTLEMHGYLVKVLEEHRLMRAALEQFDRWPMDFRQDGLRPAYEEARILLAKVRKHE